MSAEIDASTGAKAKLLIGEIDIVQRAVGGHLGAAVLTTATLLQPTHHVHFTDKLNYRNSL